MPPKKDAAGSEANGLIAGFTEKECKLLAAAFISSTGPDKYDYDVMAKLTKNTVGSLKKMWPPVKKKAMETHPSFAAFLGQASASATAAAASTARDAKAAAATTARDAKAAAAATAAAAAPKVSKKRKAADESLEDVDESPEDVDESPEDVYESPEDTEDSPEDTDESPEGADDANQDVEPTSAISKKSDGVKSPVKSPVKKKPAAEKKAPTPKKPRAANKKAKTDEVTSDEEPMTKSGDDSADGGDGIGEFTLRDNVGKWLHNTDSQ
ncbi:hypothetical protein EJ02DRAFT_90038 [Clathrospora elynae]|uniref:Uncharacterized protein n=1 Tax=Clathrospora elynae TaxID=706981 RepID=A0A6A5T5L2_9PLEO|nr:hypothetical protein EJ02DRAFT_90038 [Clathrospora elynae]